MPLPFHFSLVFLPAHPSHLYFSTLDLPALPYSILASLVPTSAVPSLACWLSCPLLTFPSSKVTPVSTLRCLFTSMFNYPAYLPDPHLPRRLKVSLPSKMPAGSPGGGAFPGEGKEEFLSNLEAPGSFDAERAVASKGCNKEPREKRDSRTHGRRRQDGRVIQRAGSKKTRTGLATGTGQRLCKDSGRLRWLLARFPDSNGI